MGYKLINKPNMDIKMSTAIVVTVLAVCATTVSLLTNNRSGMTSNREDLEFLHSTIENGLIESNDDVSSQVEDYYKNLSTNSVYDTVELTLGKNIYFAKGSTVIVTEGQLSAICNDENIIDITEGSTLAEDENAELNHLYVMPNDECGLSAREDTKILIKGGYEINNGNKE